ncbi:hypothetical protein F5Y17DRAFT_437616 [Xylariaceae sp. FL0594]|nr:hypothetical protein F5Y17DRAFT_437616 [Xylariaceae sp. FL0594]
MSSTSSSNTADQPPSSSSPLRTTKTLITTHDPSTGLATLSPSSHAAQYKSFEGGIMYFNEVYTNTFPADLNAESDISAHAERLASGKLGLATKGGSVARQVDFAPGYECMMHRTQSLDFGVVLEGEVDMLLDDGTCERLSRGDVAVQRATMHAVCPFVSFLFFPFFPYEIYRKIND